LISKRHKSEDDEEDDDETKQQTNNDDESNEQEKSLRCLFLFNLFFLRLSLRRLFLLHFLLWSWSRNYLLNEKVKVLLMR